MIICCDFDDILCDLGVKTVELYNKKFNKNLTIEDFTSFDFYEWMNKEDADNIVSLYKEKELWNSLRPIPGAKTAIQKLIDKGHHIIFATATDPCNFLWKIQWIETYFSFIDPNNIIRIMDKSLLKCDVIIDDHLGNLTKSFADRVLLDMPWNQQSELKDEAYGIHRCKNWSEIMDAINTFERENKI